MKREIIRVEPLVTYLEKYKAQRTSADLQFHMSGNPTNQELTQVCDVKLL